jgi:3alpha(or 20beta)-hydroxysteroid dehydrogenase
MSVVVITGAGQGQGAAEARLLAAHGTTVIATDLTATPAEDLPGANYRQLDVTDQVGWASLSKDLAAQYGRVSGLVANAGITWRPRLLDVTPADLHRVYEVNVTGALLAIQAIAPLMTSGGSVVLVGSAAALTGHFPVAYTASKWALRGLAKAACLELGPRGIRVNTVHPGYIETPMTASAAPAFRAASLAETPLGRTGTADDIAPLVAFLLSEQASYISGAEIPVDGGMTAHGGVKSISDAVRA